MKLDNKASVFLFTVASAIIIISAAIANLFLGTIVALLVIPMNIVYAHNLIIMRKKRTEEGI